MAKNNNKKTLTGTTIQIESKGKTTRQGNGRRSKPSHGRKLKIGQG
jgi:hypothetical protein